MEAEKKLTFKSPAVDLLASKYTMPTKAEDLNNNCLPCVLGGGYFHKNDCTRKDNTAKPELDKTLTIQELYLKLEACGNSSSCGYIGLNGTYLQYEAIDFKVDKKY